MIQRRDSRIVQQERGHVSRQQGTRAQRAQGCDHSHETGFDCELGDNLHLADAESQKGAYLMNT